MANTKSTTFTAQEIAVGNAAKMLDTGELVSGKAHLYQVEWTTGTGSAADTVSLGYIPSGYTLIPALSSVHVTAPAGSVTIAIGTTTDGDAFSTAVSIAAKAVVPFDGIAGSYTAPSRETLQATISGTTLASKKIFFNFFLVASN